MIGQNLNRMRLKQLPQGSEGDSNVNYEEQTSPVLLSFDPITKFADVNCWLNVPYGAMCCVFARFGCDCVRHQSK